MEAFARPSLLVDAQSGRIFYAEDMDHRWHPASVTKMMTAYLAFEALKAGKITLETKLVATENSTLQAPSKIGLPVNGKISMDLALKALIIKSANDVAVMIAEGVGGSEPDFVERMNATAARLGMTRTKFVNPNGLPAAEQVTTARDLARLAVAVLRDFPEYAHYWSDLDMRVGRRRIGTHNSLLKTYEGADGMKTGFICDSGYNIVATATREGRKLIVVVLGESNSRDRAVKASSLLEHGFQTAAWKDMLNTETLANAPMSADAADAISIRSTVAAGGCGGRRTPVARAEPKRKRAVKPTKAAEAGQGTVASKAKPAGATKAQ